MARAMLIFERQNDTSWVPTIVILATPKRLQGRALPGNPDRDARLARYLSDALPPGSTTTPMSAGPTRTGSAGPSTCLLYTSDAADE